ncbi:hypothetical protein JG687_00016949 [Phytophthora cactorum]|uniref:RxLR effector protein n=1 Tax=Phytophthora cactorum TaxID=29920 RepID=A0A329RKF5_9STRA|nr:hypothetical protein C6341_g19074 [Phytophthora cactorum]KAG4225682.1 hypothetical protein PC116_g25900 [Phytophthora cactorum]KAG6946035.1 hypothetical protein JG687_00016949 [Phytophthora cactorum]RAW24871.1 hypothetical protein PC110_g18713 [Phytophthora cactorum]
MSVLGSTLALALWVHAKQANKIPVSEKIIQTKGRKHAERARDRRTPAIDEVVEIVPSSATEEHQDEGNHASPELAAAANVALRKLIAGYDDMRAHGITIGFLRKRVFTQQEECCAQLSDNQEELVLQKHYVALQTYLIRDNPRKIATS